MIECVVTSSALIAALIAVRFLFRGKISRRFQYALWGLVLIRLMLPFPLLNSPLSVMNLARSAEADSALVPDIASASLDLAVPESAAPGGGAAADTAGMPASPASARETAQSAEPAAAGGKITLGEILPCVWLAGSIGVGLWIAFVNLAFGRRLRRTRRRRAAQGCRLPVYETDAIASPCLFGIVRPAVYLTPKARESAAHTEYALAHELCHYRHGDHIWPLFRGLCLAAYWWNPLVWAAAVFSRTDSELACDEAVVRQIGADNRLSYGHALVDMIAVKKTATGILCAATAMTSGKRGMKERLNMIVKNQKTAIPALLAVILTVTLLAGCTFTGAQDTPAETQGNTDTPDVVETTPEAENVNVSPAPADEAQTDTAALENAVSEAILAYNKELFLEGDFRTEAHTTLKTVAEGDETTVYASMVYLVFSFEDGGVSEIAGCDMPIALTFANGADGGYTLEDYWEPEDGGNYVTSIEEKFPSDISENAVDEDWNQSLARTQACYAAAVENGKVDTDALIAKLLDTICSSPAESSSPSDYMSEHPAEYAKLLNLGDYTLRYLYAAFLGGGQTDLRGQIMAAAVRDLLGGECPDISAATGQAWFDGWKKQAEALLAEGSMDEMKTNYPKTAIMLEMARQNG